MSPDGALGPRRAPALQGRDPDRGPVRDHRRTRSATRTSTSPGSCSTSAATAPTRRSGAPAIDALGAMLERLRAALGRLDPARARPRRRLPGAARSVRTPAAAARRRPDALARRRRVRGGDLRARSARALERLGIDPAGDPAGDRAGAGALRRRRHPPGDGRQRQAPDRADAADLGRDRLLRRLPGRRQPRVQPLDLPRRPPTPTRRPTIVADVTGRTCALDVIVPDAGLPRSSVGDVLAFLDTGAYQDAGASNFNALPRPGTALVRGRLGGADPPPRDDRGRLRPRPDPGAPARGRRRDGRRWRATGLDHVSVTSGDLDRSLAFYRDLLGLDAAGARRRARRRTSSRSPASPAPARAGRTSSSPHGQVLELIEYLDPAGHAEPPGPERPGRDAHLAAGRRHRRDLRRLREAGVPRAQRAGDDLRARRLGGRAVLLRERSRRGDRGADPAMTEPRTVWVTGAASGMGASHARRFASMGDRVGCWDVEAEALERGRRARSAAPAARPRRWSPTSPTGRRSTPAPQRCARRSARPRWWSRTPGSC